MAVPLVGGGTGQTTLFEAALCLCVTSLLSCKNISKCRLGFLVFFEDSISVVET